MKLLKEFEEKKQEIFDYFGYVEDWVVIPLSDETEYFWELHVDDGGSGFVNYAANKNDVGNDSGEYYQSSIYRQRFLNKWVYQGEEYTMIVCDTHCDGNKFLSIFDNAKEIK